MQASDDALLTGHPPHAMVGGSRMNVDNDAMMEAAKRSGDEEQSAPLSAEALIRMQPLNPYEKLEFSAVSFREPNLK